MQRSVICLIAKHDRLPLLANKLSYLNFPGYNLLVRKKHLNNQIAQSSRLISFCGIPFTTEGSIEHG